MKTSIKWLRRYVDIPWDAGELAERLTLAGLEVEGIEVVGAVPDGIVVAEIVTRVPHPNADSLSVCTVSTGAGEPLQVVCGAPNCDAGNRVPLAPVGTVLGEGFKIKKARLRGVTSSGMLCSEAELGLGSDHSGLMILPPDAPVGQPLGTVVECDAVIDWEVTPNRPDWLSHVGIAREVAAVADSRGTLRLPETSVSETTHSGGPAPARVDVQDPDLCPRYTARVVRNITVGPSPDWMQESLRAVGMRPINNVVDITNYVLMECGQPLHAFDYEMLAGRRIIVRRAQQGEKITTIDGREHELTGDNLLIADSDGGVALAGIMGGANSEITETTSTVLLESAAFHPQNIRATSRRLGLQSESSHRFERGVDIENVDYASRRACSLLCECAGGELVDGVADLYATPYEPHTVTARFGRISRLLGVDVSADDVVVYLERLGLRIEARDEDAVTVAIPSHRLDLEREVDLIEEVARLFGLANIPAEPAPARVGGPMASDRYYGLETCRRELLALGLDETLTYSFVSLQAATFHTGSAPDRLVGLANPLSTDAAYLRPSVVPGLIQTLGHNVAHSHHDLTFFEVGRVMSHEDGVPEERHQVGIVVTGRRHPERYGAESTEEYDFFDIKGLVESWFRERRITSWHSRPGSHPAFAAGCCAEIAVEEAVVAHIGQLHEELSEELRLRHPVFLGLIEWERIAAAAVAPRRHAPLPQFPAVVRDISLVAGPELSNQQIIDAIWAAKCQWLVAVELFDVYEDDGALGPGLRSCAYSLTYRDATKTLTDHRVNVAHERVRKALAKKLAVELR